MKVFLLKASSKTSLSHKNSYIRRLFYSRKGSYILEASIVYPLIIASSVMIVSLSMYYYCSAEQAFMMSEEVRLKSGESSGTVVYLHNDPSDIHSSFIMESEYSVTQGNRLIYKYTEAECSRDYFVNGMFDFGKNSSFSIYKSAINEADIICCRQFVSDILGGENSSEENTN